MPDYLGFSAKLRADNNQAEMPATSVASVSNMLCAVILDVDENGLKYCKLFADFVGKCHIRRAVFCGKV